MTETLPIHQVLDAFTARLSVKLGSALSEVKLFGSRARGDASEESDIDLLVVVDDRQRTRAAVIDIAAEVSLEYGVAISPLVRSRAQWEYLQSIRAPLAESIVREGVNLASADLSGPSGSALRQAGAVRSSPSCKGNDKL